MSLRIELKSERLEIDIKAICIHKIFVRDIDSCSLEDFVWSGFCYYVSVWLPFYPSNVTLQRNLVQCKIFILGSATGLFLCFFKVINSVCQNIIGYNI